MFDVDLAAAAFAYAAAHFVADAQLWRLREPAIRGIMKARFSFL